MSKNPIILPSVLPKRKLEENLNDEYYYKKPKKQRPLRYAGKNEDEMDEFNKAISDLEDKILLLIILKKYDEALEASNEAIKLVPSNPISYALKARALEKLCRYEELLQVSRKLIELRPNDPTYHKFKDSALENFNISSTEIPNLSLEETQVVDILSALGLTQENIALK